MRILVDMEIESPDYGPEFKEEIEELLKDIDGTGLTRLTKFKIRSKFNEYFGDGIARGLDWREKDYEDRD